MSPNATYPHRDGRRVVQGGVKRVDERERTGEQRIRSPSIPRLERDLRQADPSGYLVRPFPDADRRAEIFGRANGIADSTARRGRAVGEREG